MRLKSYFSGTVEAAMELARKELGEDAMLVDAHPSASEARHLGAYEVVFGTAPAAAAADGNRRLAQDVAEMRREIQRLARCFRGAGALAEAPQSELHSRLIANDLDPALARAVVGGASIDDLFEVDSTPGRIMALVGPPGVGKTTTLVKLAARYGLTSRKPSHIISTDVYRIAAADQLRSLAAILGIGCDVVETPVGLAQVIEEHRAKEYIFIDTPGLAPDEMEDGADLARAIASHPEIDTHLVLGALMKSADMSAVIERYQMFQPKKLLFTRIDETASYGPIVNQSSRRGLPVSFLSTGQRIPDDFEPATKQRIAALAMGISNAVAVAAGAAA
ncbi:MAG: GTPase [Bryobacteraceae bacterium]